MVTTRPMRVDARRNHDRLVAEAAAVFFERGIDVPLEEIARRADVGIGTLYRHFPTRDALIEAVYRREVEQLCEAADQLLVECPPGQALEEWLQRFVAYVATKRGMAMALKSVVGADSELFVETHQRIHAAVNGLVDAGVRAHAIRADVDPMDLLRAVSGICLATDRADWREHAARLVALLMDGMRYGV
ncbi:MAG TPA: helix-turn-helix domain-containing protein [Mycobacteriales bacterium]|nr:helix-turn-helix domain-containing protein [Mycobacteriales bacterium]